MKVPGYDQDIRSIHDWEDYLDWQDTHISVKSDRVICKFNSQYEIPLSDCDTPGKALVQAISLANTLEMNEPNANARYIGQKLIRLVNDALNLQQDLPKTYDELWGAFAFSPRAKIP